MEKVSLELQSNLTPTTSSNLNVSVMSRKPRALRVPRVKDSTRNSQVATVAAAPPTKQYITYTKSVLPMTQLCLNGELINVPQILIEDQDLFLNVVSENAFWMLSDASRNYLKRFLPPSYGVQEEERIADERQILKYAFTKNENFCFGSPLSKVFRRIKHGHFNVNHIADEVQLRNYHRVLYDHHIRHYYVNLLNKVLIARQVIMNQASSLGPQEKVVIPSNSYFSMRKLKRSKALQNRAKVRAKKMIQHCQNKAGGCESSSDDNDEECKNIQHISLVPGAESTIYSKKFSEHDFDLHLPIQIKETKELYKEYRHLCETEPDCPSYDITDLYLEEVYDRAGVSFQSERNFAANFIEKNEQQRNKDDNASQMSSSTHTVSNSIFSED